MATSKKYPELSCKTILADLNDIESRLAGTYPILPNTTLNYKYSVFQGLTNLTAPPKIGYFGLGIRGFYNVGDDTQSSPYQPRANEMDLYYPIPFRCVPVDEDLSVTERAQYRMRVRKVINSVAYYCYYLKPIVMLDNSTQIVKIDPDTQQEVPYELSPTNLTPTPIIPTTSGTQDGTIADISVTKRVRIPWTGKEIYEVINVLFEGDLTYAKISEIGIYSGEDRSVEGYDANNNTLRYTEAIYTQLAYKICSVGSTVTSAQYDGSRIITFGNGKLLLANA